MAWTPALKQIIVLEQGGRNFPNVSEYIESLVLAANTVADYDVAALRASLNFPADTPFFVIFGSDGPFWCHFHAEASIPLANTTDGSGSQFSPNQVYIDGTVTTISVIAPADGHLSLAFYRT